VHHIIGDISDEATVERSHPENASLALVIDEEDGNVLVTTVMIRHLAPELPIICVARSTKIASALRDLGVLRTIATDDLLGHTLAKSVETPHASDLLMRLIESEGLVMAEISVNPEMLGQHLSEVRAAHHGLVLGLVHGGDVVLGVEHDPIIESGDALLAMTSAGH